MKKVLSIILLLAITPLSICRAENTIPTGTQITGYISLPAITEKEEREAAGRKGYKILTDAVNQWINLNPGFKVISIAPNTLSLQTGRLIYAGVWIVYEKK